MLGNWTLKGIVFNSFKVENVNSGENESMRCLVLFLSAIFSSSEKIFQIIKNEKPVNIAFQLNTLLWLFIEQSKTQIFKIWSSGFHVLLYFHVAISHTHSQSLTAYFFLCAFYIMFFPL